MKRGRIASVVVREALYRSRRRWRRRKLRVTSALKTNIIGILAFSFISLSVGSIVLDSPGLIAQVFGILGVIEFIVGAYGSASNVNVILEEKLLEPLTYLPVDERVIRREVFLSIFYWGGVYLLFLVAPAAFLASMALKSVKPFLWGLIEALTIFVLAEGLGFIIGSLSPRYTRSILSRAVQTLIWLVFMSIGMFYFLTVRALESLSVWWIKVVPPFSFGAAFESLSSAAASLSLTVLSVIIFKLGVKRFWRRLTAGRIVAPPVVAAWKVEASKFALLRKDLKLLLRNPRVLASSIYYSIVFPLFIIAPFIAGLGGEALKFLPGLAVFLGGTGGTGVYYYYVIEGEGAKTLYFLPINRKRLAREKVLLLTLIDSLAVIAFLAVGVLTRKNLIGLVAAVSYWLTAYGSGLLNSMLLVRMLPKQLSSWSRETFGRGKIMVLSFVETIVFGSLSFIPVLFSTGTLFYIVALVESGVIAAVGLLATH